jgi:O-6-methylguanine DNA methyltransferase
MKQESRDKKLPPFHYRVYRILRSVPRGKVTTYRALARAAGSPRASRAVGSAMNRNPYAPAVPCHRVVRSDGSVGGFARGTREKARMLAKEGVEIRNGRIDLARFGWKK